MAPASDSEIVRDVRVGPGCGSMEMSEGENVTDGVRLGLGTGELSPEGEPVELAKEREVGVAGDALDTEAAEKLDLDAGAVSSGADAEMG